MKTFTLAVKRNGKYLSWRDPLQAQLDRERVRAPSLVKFMKTYIESGPPLHIDDKIDVFSGGRHVGRFIVARGAITRASVPT